VSIFANCAAVVLGTDIFFPNLASPASLGGSLSLVDAANDNL
jgi:hypothetical protein